MRVSNNSIQTFKRCRRLWELQYKYNLEPVQTAPALETGLTYHDKIEQLIKTGDFEMDEDPKTNAMASAFKRYILPHMPEKFDPEVWFERETPGGNMVVGRYDGLGEKFLLEHKTTSGKVDGAYWAALELDEQILTYMMASGKRKVFYTVCQKPTIRQTKNETYESFQERCNAWFDVDTESKIAYQVLTRSNDEVYQHQADLDRLCKEMEACDNFYRNTCQCFRWGRPCEFLPICKHYDPDKTYVQFKKRGE